MTYPHTPNDEEPERETSPGSSFPSEPPPPPPPPPPPFGVHSSADSPSLHSSAPPPPPQPPPPPPPPRQSRTGQGFTFEPERPKVVYSIGSAPLPTPLPVDRRSVVTKLAAAQAAVAKLTSGNGNGSGNVDAASLSVVATALGAARDAEVEVAFAPDPPAAPLAVQPSPDMLFAYAHPHECGAPLGSEPIRCNRIRGHGGFHTRAGRSWLLLGQPQFDPVPDSTSTADRLDALAGLLADRALDARSRLSRNPTPAAEAASPAAGDAIGSRFDAPDAHPSPSSKGPPRRSKGRRSDGTGDLFA